MDFDLSGQVALITGGCRGIGRGIAQQFLDRGAEVVVCARNEPADPISCGERAAVFEPADVRDPEQCTSLIDRVVEHFGRLDVLVNNAGGSPFAEAATASPRFSTSIVTLNLLAPLYVSQPANAVMQRQETGGVIINITSVSGMRPSPGTAAYGAAKAGLINLSQSLAVEWAPKVRVACVTGGLVLTEQADLHYGDADGVARVARTVPLGRLGVPEDIANACLFLASPYASYCTGANIVLHGGGERPAFLDAAEEAGELAT